MPVKIFKVNPKSVPINNLYGYINLHTNDWNDGVFLKIIKLALDDQANSYWIIFDGPIDSMWVENLNAVLDENKTLCLSNG